jgi:hypothetical protein
MIFLRPKLDIYASFASEVSEIRKTCEIDNGLKQLNNYVQHEILKDPSGSISEQCSFEMLLWLPTEGHKCDT